MYDFELERLNLGEITKEEYLKNNNISEEELEKKLKALKASDEEILQFFPASSIKKNIEEKIEKTNKSNEKPNVLKFPTKKHNSWIQVAVAAVILCAVGLPVTLSQRTTEVRTKGNENSGIIAKGSNTPKLNLYKLVDSKAVKLRNKETVKAGDVIQLSYNAGVSSYGIIFSIDGNGVLTQHFPESGMSAKLISGKECILDFSYELDNAPKYEKFFFITSKTEFDLSDLEITTKTAKVNSNSKDINVFMFELKK